MSRTPNTPEKRDERKIVLILPRQHGFFSLVFQAVGQAYLAEKDGTVPVVYFNRHCLYWSEEGFNGARNVWEYYFEPLSEIKVEDLFPVGRSELEDSSLDHFTKLSSGTNITVTKRYPPVIEYKSPIGICLERGFVNKLLRKYLIVKPHIRNKVDEYCRDHFHGHPFLGVHYRGIEKAHGKETDSILSRKEGDMRHVYLRQMKRYLDKHPKARVFVATDSVQFLEEAKAAFGDAVCALEATRLETADEIKGLHFSDHAKSKGALLGEEVLLDALILAKANFFIHGISSVSNAALFLNPRMKHIDIEIVHGRTAVYVRREFYRLMGRLSPTAARQVERLEAFIRF